MTSIQAVLRVLPPTKYRTCNRVERRESPPTDGRTDEFKHHHKKNHLVRQIQTDVKTRQLKSTHSTHRKRIHRPQEIHTDSEEEEEGRGAEIQK